MECCWWLANKEKYWVYKGHFFIPPSFINMWFYWHIKVAYIQNVQCGSRWCKSWSWKVQEPGTIKAGDNGCPSLKRERVCASFIFLFQWTGWCPSGISSFSPLNQILISSRNTPQAHPEIMFTSYLGLFSPVKLTHLIHLIIKRFYPFTYISHFSPICPQPLLTTILLFASVSLTFLFFKRFHI